MAEINFMRSTDEANLIRKIVRRTVLEGAYYEDRLTMEMDITSVHLNGCPLDLEQFLDCSSNDFAHDIFGIENNIDRETGHLNNNFIPLCAKGAS
ncbi:MAG: hypothetical protein ACPKOP_04165 [Sphaerochaetaceae bacterium]